LRALDGAARLLHGRIGRIDVVYVAHLSSLDMLSHGARGSGRAGHWTAAARRAAPRSR